MGAGSYALLTSAGVSPQTSLLIMLIVPVGLAATFWCLISPSRAHSSDEYLALADDEDLEDEMIPRHSELTLLDKLNLVRTRLIKYMIPLGLVYYSEYLINQGIFELLYYPSTFLSHQQQYRWYQLTYQLGVLISRSSLSCLVINRIYILSIFQGLNLLLLTYQSVYFPIIGNFGLILTFLFILWEGLLGGAAYVNTFHKISEESNDRDREFSLGISSLADSTAIGFAAISALPLHNWICDLPL